MTATLHHLTFEENSRLVAFQAAAPIVMALQRCDEELRAQALELFEQLGSGQLDETERFATVALIADILFPGSGEEEPDEDAAETQQHGQFAERVKRLMEERGLTQAELAEKIGIGQSSISMLLSRGCRPQRRTVQRLAEALGVRPEYLWMGFGD